MSLNVKTADGREVVAGNLDPSVIDDLQENKQDKLIPGDNITIIDNVISATGSGASTWSEIAEKPFSTIGNELNVVDDKLNYKANYGTTEEFNVFKQRTDIPDGSTYHVTDDFVSGGGSGTNIKNVNYEIAVTIPQKSGYIDPAINIPLSDLPDDLTQENIMMYSAHLTGGGYSIALCGYYLNIPDKQLEIRVYTWRNDIPPRTIAIDILYRGE